MEVKEKDSDIEIILINPELDKCLYQEEKEIRLKILLLPTGRSEWWSRDFISKHILARHGKSIIGCALLVLGEEEKRLKTAILCQMAVDVSFRFRGVGKRVVKMCEEIALNEGIERICIPYHFMRNAAM
jgi:N-acetylglutamate synthase-like GNAT family acetyltransferase